MKIRINELISILDIPKEEFLNMYPNIYDQIQLANIMKLTSTILSISIILLIVYFIYLNKKYTQLKDKYQMSIDGDFEYVIPYDIYDDDALIKSIKNKAISYQFKLNISSKIAIIFIFALFGLRILNALGAPDVSFILNLG